MPVFECRTEVGVTPEELFDFITNVSNIQRITPPEVDMVIVEAPEVLSEGAKLIFKVQMYGFAQQLEHEIVAFDRPKSFREKMLKGPLPSWTHDYIIEPHGDGMAALINRIEFEPPGGMLGMLVTADRILKHMEESYEQRSETLKKVLGS